MNLSDDPLHSQLEFKIKHLMISHVRGTFESFNVRMETKDSTFQGAKIECIVDVDTLQTHIEDRDRHLKSADFFDVRKYPKMIFRSTQVRRIKGDEYCVDGKLTIKGRPMPIQLKVVFNGQEVDQFGQLKYGFEISGSIKRSNWDLNFNLIGGSSTLLIDDEVHIEANIQMM